MEVPSWAVKDSTVSIILDTALSICHGNSVVSVFVVGDRLVGHADMISNILESKEYFNVLIIGTSRC